MGFKRIVTAKIKKHNMYKLPLSNRVLPPKSGNNMTKMEIYYLYRFNHANIISIPVILPYLIVTNIQFYSYKFNNMMINCAKC